MHFALIIHNLQFFVSFHQTFHIVKKVEISLKTHKGITKNKVLQGKKLDSLECVLKYFT
jgi:hypothetical protein